MFHKPAHKDMASPAGQIRHTDNAKTLADHLREVEKRIEIENCYFDKYTYQERCAYEQGKLDGIKEERARQRIGQKNETSY